MVNSANFGKRLQQILTYYGISATNFSNQLQVNRSTISHLLSGRNKPSLDFVLKVLEKFPEVELYWLLNGKGTFPSKKGSTPPLTPKNKIVENTPSNQNPSGSKPNYLQESLISQDPSIEQIIIFYKDGSFKVYKN